MGSLARIKYTAEPELGWKPKWKQAMFNNFGGHFGKMGYIQPGISGRGGGRKWLETLTLLELADVCHALITKWRKFKPIWSHRNLNPNYQFWTKGSFLLLILADRPACVLTRYHIITQSPHSRFFPQSAIKSPSCTYHTAFIPRGWQVSGVTFRATYWEEMTLMMHWQASHS